MRENRVFPCERGKAWKYTIFDASAPRKSLNTTQKREAQLLKSGKSTRQKCPTDEGLPRV